MTWGWKEQAVTDIAPALIDCGHGPGICEKCAAALDELLSLADDLGITVDVVYVVRP